MHISTKTAAACALLLAGCAEMQAGTKWTAEIKCSARGDPQPFTQTLPVRVERNEFFISNQGAPSQPGYVRLSGIYDPDDRLQLMGEMAPAGGQPEKVLLEGRRDGKGFVAYGRAGRQNCSVMMRPE
jgi:hypothetical protein